MGYIYTIKQQIDSVMNDSNPNVLNPTIIHHTFFPKVILAGRAELTLKNLETGVHIKVKFRQKKDKRTGKPGNCYYVYLALLMDGKLGYDYVGCYFSDTHNGKVGTEVLPGTREYAIFHWLMASIRKPINLSSLEIQHSGRCACCKQKLTHPWSLKVALGPVCFQRIFGVPNDEEAQLLLELGILEAVNAGR